MVAVCKNLLFKLAINSDCIFLFPHDFTGRGTSCTKFLVAQFCPHSRSVATHAPYLILHSIKLLMENATITMCRFYVERMRRRPKHVLQLLLGTLLNWSNNMFCLFYSCLPLWENITKKLSAWPLVNSTLKYKTTYASTPYFRQKACFYTLCMAIYTWNSWMDASAFG